MTPERFPNPTRRVKRPSTRGFKFLFAIDKNSDAASARDDLVAMPLARIDGESVLRPVGKFDAVRDQPHAHAGCDHAGIGCGIHS